MERSINLFIHSKIFQPININSISIVEGRKKMRQLKLTLITIVSILFILSSITYSVTFTLSDKGILMLDCNNDSRYYPKMTAKVIDRRDIEGPGVEFDIQYF